MPEIRVCALAAALFVVMGIACAAPPAEARTTVLTYMDQIYVQGEAEDNNWVIEDSIMNRHPGAVPVTAFVAPPTKEALKSAQDSVLTRMRMALEGATEAAPAASRMVQVVRLAATVGLMLSLTQISGDHPAVDEEQLQPERVILVHDRSPAPVGAVPPCRVARRTQQLDPSKPPTTTVACPLNQTSQASPPGSPLRQTLAVFAGAGDDRISLSFHEDAMERVVEAESGADTVYGSRFIDQIGGGWGNDTILGGEGNDTIMGPDISSPSLGESDRDALYGNRGNDRISGGPDIDLIDGGNDDDAVVDLRWIDADNPIIEEVQRRLQRTADPVKDTFRAAVSNFGAVAAIVSPALHGGSGNDTVVGGDDRDGIDGGPGRDTILARESDHGGPDVADLIADCSGTADPTAEPGASASAPAAEPGEYFRASPANAVPGSTGPWADPIRNCDTPLEFPVSDSLLDSWTTNVFARMEFVWYFPDGTPH